MMHHTIHIQMDAIRYAYVNERSIRLSTLKFDCFQFARKFEKKKKFSPKEYEQIEHS